MLNFLKQFNSKENKSPDDIDYSQAIIISFDSTGEFGTTDEQEKAYDLEDALIDSLAINGLGDLDGHEFGDNECRIYIYGSSAEKIYDVIQPILKDFTLKPVRILLRLGPVNDRHAKEIKDRIL